MNWDPTAILLWVVAGLVVGLVAGRLLRRPSSTLGADLALGVVGAVVAGVLVQLVGYSTTLGHWGTATVALLGAIIVLGLGRLLVART